MTHPSASAPVRDRGEIEAEIAAWHRNIGRFNNSSPEERAQFDALQAEFDALPPASGRTEAGEREQIAALVHRGRFWRADGQKPTPFEDERSDGRNYCLHIADTLLAAGVRIDGQEAGGGEYDPKAVQAAFERQLPRSVERLGEVAGMLTPAPDKGVYAQAVRRAAQIAADRALTCDASGEAGDAWIARAIEKDIRALVPDTLGSDGGEDAPLDLARLEQLANDRMPEGITVGEYSRREAELSNSVLPLIRRVRSLEAPPSPNAPTFRESPGRRFKIEERVEKIKGSSWRGRIVGFYSTSLTPFGYCIESENEPGSVQLYPEAAIRSLSPQTCEGGR